MRVWGWILAPGLAVPVGSSTDPFRRILWAGVILTYEGGWFAPDWEERAPSRWARVVEVS